MKKSSITTRLIILISLGFCFGFSILSYFADNFLKQNFHDSYQDFLQNEHAVLQEIFNNSTINLKTALQQEVILEPDANDYKFYIEIHNPAGDTLINTPGLYQVISGYTANSGQQYIQSGGKNFILLNTTLERKNQVFRTLIALDISKDTHILKKFRRGIFLISAFLTLIFLFVSMLLIGIGLSPLRVLITKINTISLNKLEPLVLNNPPSDIALLLAEINQLILRTKSSYESLASFSSNIAHELRTPINNLMISDEIFLQQQAPDNEKKIQSNIEEYQRLSQLIDKLLFLSRLDTVENKLNLTTLDVNVEANKVIDFHEAMAKDKKIIITSKLTGLVIADKDLFHNALSNLLTNALKYSPNQTHISITSKEQQNTLTLAITDQGPGIPESEFEKITDRFYRTDKNRSSKTGGLGLGLSIVKSIMLALGGKIYFKNNQPRGLVVHLTFISAKQPANIRH